ncbi:type 4a pilus biogenesis protein PilO [Deinococcus depolymerans]|uniref:Type II secretion system protein M n=1 Tax=Deinococcus depolymerans TaxID=392408 RepID=A0ABN1CHJ3_9DEIO
MLTKLSPRNLFLAALGLCLVILALWYTMRFQPRQAEISNLKGELETVNARVTLLRDNARKVPALREEVAKLKVQQDEFLAALPQTANFGGVLDELRLTSSAAGASMESFNVQSGNAVGLPAGVRPIGLNLSVSGRFAQLFQMLRSVETMSRFTTVNNLSLQLPEATSLDPELQGTLALTVYTFDPSQAATGTPGAPDAAPAAPAAPAPAGGTQ